MKIAAPAKWGPPIQPNTQTGPSTLNQDDGRDILDSGSGLHSTTLPRLPPKGRKDVLSNDSGYSSFGGSSYQSSARSSWRDLAGSISDFQGIMRQLFP